MRAKSPELSASLLARKQAFTTTALELFLELGFDKTSVNAIVRRSGGSLTTLYKLYPSKAALFEAIISEHLQFMFEPLKALTEDSEPELVLRTIGANYISVASTPRAVAIFRVLVLEAHRSPQLREAFLNQGFSKLKAWFATFLLRCKAAGKLHIVDVDIAGAQFFGLLRAPWHLQAACGESVDLSERNQIRIVESAVRVFLEAHRATLAP